VNVDRKALGILESAVNGQAPTRDECACLLAFPAESLEAAFARSVGDVVSRARFGNKAVLLGQIGVEIAPCPGGCKFCSFGEGHTSFQPSTMPLEEVLARAHALTKSGDLFALFLMTMHTFDFQRLLDTIRSVRAYVHPATRIVVNIGDFGASQARELKSAGVDGAYHVLRLREGTDTSLDPAGRKETIRAIKGANLQWYYCCEPIGPEHSPEELVYQMFVGLEYGCFQHAAMRRVHIPDSPLAHRGQITELRLAQVIAVVALASMACPATRSIAVHEPNLLGLAAGANSVYAESGANPRDTEADTSGHRGADAPACRKMLYEAGYAALQLGDGGLSELTLDSLLQSAQPASRQACPPQARPA